MEMLKQRAGIDLTHVPFKGGAPARRRPWPAIRWRCSPAARARRRSSAASCARLPSPDHTARARFPICPTIAEFYPGYEVTIWLGLFAPAGTPEPILARLAPK